MMADFGGAVPIIPDTFFEPLLRELTRPPMFALSFVVRPRLSFFLRRRRWRRLAIRLGVVRREYRLNLPIEPSTDGWTTLGASKC